MPNLRSGKSLRVAIRADASLETGTGHVMRCLCLADELAAQGAEVRFLTRALDASLADRLRERNHRIVALPTPLDPPDKALPSSMGEFRFPVAWDRDAAEVREELRGESADLLIVDHYGLDARWESEMRPWAAKVMVLDDGPGRPHECDILLDQNLHGRGGQDYGPIVPAHCVKLLGPSFALLRPEFRTMEKGLPQRTGAVRKVLVFFGGSDPGNETGKALEGLKRAGCRDVEVTVVAGPLNPHLGSLQAIGKGFPSLTLYKQVDFMAKLMREADLAIGAGGSATWERCCLGLPALVAVLAENQAEIAEAVAGAGAQVNLGWAHDLGPDHYARAYLNLDEVGLLAMTRIGMALVDGKGSCRVAENLLRVCGSIPGDSERIEATA